MNMTNSFFITGVGTDVGKTYISALLYKELKKYTDIGYYKPIQSGCFYENGKLIAPDLKFLADFSKNPYDDEMCTYALVPEVSPHLASELENKKIDMEIIYKEIENKKQKYKTLLLEGAGGVYVPLIRDKFYIYDFIKKIDFPVILVANTKVGGINHAMLSIKFLESLGIKIHGIVFNGYTGEIYEDDNIKVVLKDSKIKNYLIVRKNQTEIKKEELFRFFGMEDKKC